MVEELVCVQGSMDIRSMGALVKVTCKDMSEQSRAQLQLVSRSVTLILDRHLRSTRTSLHSGHLSIIATQCTVHLPILNQCGRGSSTDHPLCLALQ